MRSKRAVISVIIYHRVVNGFAHRNGRGNIEGLKSIRIVLFVIGNALDLAIRD